MSSIVTALRKFITNATRIFHGAKSLIVDMAKRWAAAVRTLGEKVGSLAKRFSALRVSEKNLANGEKVAMLGEMEGKEFTKMLRTGRSIAAFEKATKTVLSPAARSSFKHLDDIASLHFPDISIVKRAEYISQWRDALVANKIIKETERVTDALVLEKIIRGDAATLKRTNSLLSKVSKNKKLIFLGTTVAIAAGIGIPILCRTLTNYALSHSGCFMYTRDLTNGVRKCRITGCSCPVQPATAFLVSPAASSSSPAPPPLAPSSMQTPATMNTCDERDLWEKMHLRNNDCAKAATKKPPYCVHCNWDETDPQSVDYVNKDLVPENAYVRCETMDALDALNETIGATVDKVFGDGAKIANMAKESLASSVNVIPWLFGGVAVLIVIFVLIFIWRFTGGAFGGKAHDDGHEHEHEREHEREHDEHRETEDEKMETEIEPAVPTPAIPTPAVPTPAVPTVV